MGDRGLRQGLHEDPVTALGGLFIYWTQCDVWESGCGKKNTIKKRERKKRKRSDEMKEGIKGRIKEEKNEKRKKLNQEKGSQKERKGREEG